jgi:ribonuclease HII
MKHSNFNLEKSLLKRGFKLIIGIDEAGRGPLAGPVVAVATTARNYQLSIINYQISNLKSWDLIRDSKLLSEKQRENIFDFIEENFYYGVGICDHKTIDRINILEATFLAMKKAITSLTKEISKSGLSKNKYIILVDGNKKIPNFSAEQKAIINGDKIVKSISAASIIAKVTRDRIMKEMHKKYPRYKFNQHKGYGTKLHIKLLRKHGPSAIHRRSFEPVKTLVKMGK